MHSIKLFVIFVSFSVVFSEKARFDNYRLYAINIETEKQLEMLKELESNQDGMAFIEPPIKIGNDAQIMVPPHKFGDIKDFFETNNFKTELKFNNLQRLILV